MKSMLVKDWLEEDQRADAARLRCACSNSEPSRRLCCGTQLLFPIRKLKDPSILTRREAGAII